MPDCMNILKSAVDWLNVNQGFCMVLLTFAMAVCAMVSCRISAKAMREQSRPHVVVAPCSFERDLYFGVALRNCGMSTAYDIQFKWETAPICPWRSMAASAESKFLQEPIGSLRAGVGYKTFLGTIKDLKGNEKDLVYRGWVTYKDSTGKKYREDLVVDFHMFDKRGIVPDDIGEDTNKMLMRISDQLAAIRGYTDHLKSKDEFEGMSALRRVRMAAQKAGGSETSSEVAPNSQMETKS